MGQAASLAVGLLAFGLVPIPLSVCERARPGIDRFAPVEGAASAGSGGRLCGLTISGQVRCARPDPGERGDNPDAGFVAEGLGQTTVRALEPGGVPRCWGVAPGPAPVGDP